MGNFGSISDYWGYGMVGFYALGFGFPYLLDLPEDRLKCGATNFLETLNQYKLSNGMMDLFDTNLPISDIKTIVGEFNAWVRIQVSCITSFEGDLIEAAEVGYLLDELNAAMATRLDLEEAARKEIMMNISKEKDEKEEMLSNLNRFTAAEKSDWNEKIEFSNDLIDLNEINVESIT